MTKKNEEVKTTILVNFTGDELASLITLVTISHETFSYMLEVAHKEGNQAMITSISARLGFCEFYIKKLNDALDLGEPLSKALH
jgi:hypothetical protein